VKTLAILSLKTSSSPTDILLKDDVALVATEKEVILVNLTDPMNPKLAGVLKGIGGRLALTESNLLFSTARSLFGGDTDLGGIRTASLEQVAIVTAFKPDPIAVSAGSEVFQDVDLNYKLIPPDPAITTAEVRIDVRDGSRVASLPGALDEKGNGVVEWPQGTIVNLFRTYEATVHAVKDNEPVRTFPKRLKFDKVPLAITTRDRLLRIQFALPEQGLFTERKYSVLVYLAAQGQEFAAAPSFLIRSRDIEGAYPNTEVWWDDLPSVGGKAEESWVTRKIDKMVLPPGTDTTIRRQAFEIGTILSGYPRIKVAVISEETGKELEVKQGTINADLDWSEVIERVTNRVRTSAGDFLPVDPIIPPPTFFDPTDPFGRLRGLAFRVLHVLDDVLLAYGTGLLKGLVAGFLAGIEGDVQTVELFKTAFTQSPVTTARSLYEFFKEAFQSLPGPDDVIRIVRNLYEGGANAEFPPLEEAIIFGADKSGYFGGFLVGFVLEQALVIVALAIATRGIGAIAKIAIDRLKAVGWIGSIILKVSRFIRALGYWLETVARLSRLPEAAKAALQFMREFQELVGQLMDKYKKVDKLIKRLAEIAQTAKGAAAAALRWLTIVDQMSEAAALRFIRFFEKTGEVVGNKWLTRWVGFRTGKRAVKEAFEAYEKTGEVADTVHDALVTAAEHVNTAERNVVKDYVEKYRNAPEGDRVPSSLSRLRDAADRNGYSDEALARTMRALSGPNLPSLSDDAVEGALRFMAKAGDDIPLEIRELAMGNVLSGTRDESEALLRFVREAPNDGEVQGFARFFRDIPCPAR